MELHGVSKIELKKMMKEATRFSKWKHEGGLK